MLRAPRSAAFALVASLAFVLFLMGVVWLAAVLIRSSLDIPAAAQVRARSQAMLGLDAALVRLSEVAATDDVATFNASLMGEATHADWVGAWKRGGLSPQWLVSGENPSLNDAGNVAIVPDGVTGWRVPLVSSATGGYAYAVEDLSQQSVSGELDRLDSLNPAWPDDVAILRQQAFLEPEVLDGSPSMNWGVLADPTTNTLKVALDADESLSDSNVIHAKQWRSDDDFILGRPLIWPEVALIMGIYHGADDRPQLGLAFWADAWNPYACNLPFNQRGQADFQLRVQAPSAIVRYYTATGSLAAIGRLDMAEHTAEYPIATDLYGTMQPGEIRFITHYRLEPIAPNPDADIAQVQVDFDAGPWSFIFETFDGQLIQKIESIPYAGFSRRFNYNYMSTYDLTWGSAQWVVAWKRSQPLRMNERDPRAKVFDFDARDFVYNADPVDAQQNQLLAFSSSELYHDGAQRILFDSPKDSVLGVGALRHAVLEGVPALSLGSVAAGAQNFLFDRYFFSTLPEMSSLLSMPLPSSRLRLVGSPSLTQARSQPAAHMLVRGAFNINTAAAGVWASQIPPRSYGFEFQPADTYLGSQQSLSSSARQSMGLSIAQYLVGNGPYTSIGDFASEGLIDADLFARMAPYLCVRGDTFAVYAYGEAPNGAAKALARAVVQRLPEVSASGQGRCYQVLKVDWLY